VVLHSLFNPTAVFKMNFPLNAYLAAGASAFLVTLLTAPLWRRWCIQTGLVDDPGHRKIHSAPVPLSGGLSVAAGLVVPLLAAVVYLLLRAGGEGLPATPPDDGSVRLLGYGLGRRALQLAAICIGAVGMLLLGWLDDRRELKPAAKFIGQLLIAFAVAGADVRITLFVPNVVFSYAITILWILTIVNAMNFMDNMNGLCAGLSIIGSFYFGFIAALSGHYLVASMAFLVCGAFLGFLPYNFPRAKAFLGDAGSHLAGYLLAVLAILPHFHSPERPRKLAVLAPLFVLAVPLIDLVWVVLLRWRAGKPFYIGDTNHLSHRLARSGLSRIQAVIAIWIFAIMVGAIALLV
jgi:UDP-GlcNAc:undecaprenyl-phosphate/decaprenyl-phosphate GlcNAc-1-phosphate transferase